VRRTRMRQEEGIHEPNMTPVIDVSLVLVVILLVSTPMAFQSSITVQRAAKAGQAAKFTAKSERVEIEVLSPEVVAVNQNQVP
jgi:biopolymer transport protein ExbD